MLNSRRDPEIRQDFRDGRKSYCFPIYVLTVQRPVFNPSKISRHKFLFCNESMPERMPDVLEKWMSDSDNLQPMKHHLVDSMVYKPVVGSVDFLQVCRRLRVSGGVLRMRVIRRTRIFREDDRRH